MEFCGASKRWRRGTRDESIFPCTKHSGTGPPWPRRVSYYISRSFLRARPVHDPASSKRALMRTENWRGNGERKRGKKRRKSRLGNEYQDESHYFSPANFPRPKHPGSILSPLPNVSSPSPAKNIQALFSPLCPTSLPLPRPKTSRLYSPPFAQRLFPSPAKNIQALFSPLCPTSLPLPRPKTSRLYSPPFAWRLFLFPGQKHPGSILSPLPDVSSSSPASLPYLPGSADEKSSPPPQTSSRLVAVFECIVEWKEECNQSQNRPKNGAGRKKGEGSCEFCHRMPAGFGFGRAQHQLNVICIQNEDMNLFLC